MAPMKTIACLAAALAAAAGIGCRGSDPPRRRADDPAAAAPPAATAPTTQHGTAAGAPPAQAYAGDIAKLCDVVRLSGAEAESPQDRRVPIANWLAANLSTTESRQFLAQIQPLDGAAKADALDAEARRVGLPGCALAAEWRSPPTR